MLYDHKGEKERAIADYRAGSPKSRPEDRKDIEAALDVLAQALISPMAHRHNRRVSLFGAGGLCHHDGFARGESS